MALPIPRPGILDIPLYAASEARPGVDYAINIGSNESALGPSPRAAGAYSRAARELHRYPEIDGRSLREAIGRHYGLDPARIICGAGSDELLEMIGHSYAGEGDEVLYNAHGFQMYPIVALAAGAKPVKVPETKLTANVDAFLAAVTPRTRLVFLANPNNPTGTYLPLAELRRLRVGLPENVLLVVDAAYSEYVVRNDYSPGMELVDAGGNTVMTRTFSKIHALASLRLGWGYFPSAIAQVIERVRPPFNISQAAIEAGKAALADVAHTDRSRANNDTVLPWFSRQLAGLGLEVNPSVANFVIARFPDDKDRDAATAYAWLKERRIIVRRIVGYGLPAWLRFTIGTPAEMAAVGDAIEEFLAR
ncbi:MAG: histidinol-phosphate transaminase [Alphaproteobacteria bacterium]|nr:histidinol-phosphate transaminase [Alphaproteobacteria bacterium]